MSNRRKGECCGNVFVRRIELKKHTDEKHARLWEFYCDLCGKGCSSKGRMKVHIGLEQGYINVRKARYW